MEKIFKSEQSLKRIEKMLSTENASICGEDLKTTLIYLKHYMEGVKFEDLPEDWVCPLCGVGKDMFKEIEE